MMMVIKCNPPLACANTLPGLLVSHDHRDTEMMTIHHFNSPRRTGHINAWLMRSCCRFSVIYWLSNVRRQSQKALGGCWCSGCSHQCNVICFSSWWLTTIWITGSIVIWSHPLHDALL